MSKSAAGRRMARRMREIGAGSGSLFLCGCDECITGRLAARERIAARGPKINETQEQFAARMAKISAARSEFVKGAMTWE